MIALVRGVIAASTWARSILRVTGSISANTGVAEYFGGRPVRTFNSGTCTMEIAFGVGQFHVGSLQARVVGPDFLHGGFQVWATDTTVAGNKAAGVVLCSDYQLVILEGQVRRASCGTRRDDVAPETVGHR